MNGSISTRKAALLVGVIPAGIILIIAAVFLIAPAAHAATAAIPTEPVQFSNDGIHWSDSYTGALFGGVMLIPGESVDRAFYVRNGAADAANLRVTLFDVAATDTSLAAAMTLATSIPGNPGPVVPVTDARPCATLSQGTVLAAGDSVKLDNVAALADLTGTTGQSRAVSFKLAISLSSTDSSAPAPNSCPTDYDTGTGTGTVTGAPSPGTGTSAHPVYHLTAGGWTPVSGIAAGQVAEPPAQELPADSALVVNTQRLFQENFVAMWLAMAVIGAILLFIVRRRRRDDDDAALDQYPYARQPTTQNGTGR